MNIQKLFKPYIVTRKNGQCQVLIPLVELDALCEDIENLMYKNLKRKPQFTIEQLRVIRELCEIVCDLKNVISGGSE